LTTLHCILSAELTKTHVFFGDFAHWVRGLSDVICLLRAILLIEKRSVIKLFVGKGFSHLVFQSLFDD